MTRWKINWVCCHRTELPILKFLFLNPANHSSCGRETLDNKIQVWIIGLLVFQTNCHVITQREIYPSMRPWRSSDCKNDTDFCRFVPIFRDQRAVAQFGERVFKNFLITGAFVLVLIGLQRLSGSQQSPWKASFGDIPAHDVSWVRDWNLFSSFDRITDCPCSQCEDSTDQ